MKIEVSAKTIEKAIEDGLKQLNTTIENVDVKIISEGGMFKKAKIEMALSEEEGLELNETNKEKQNSELKEISTPVPQELETQVIIENEIEDEQIKPKEILTNIVKASENLVDEMTEEQKHERKQELISETINLAKQWLEGLIYAYNVNAEIQLEPRENDIYANIIGENLGVLIGYHGEAMEAIQHLLNTHLFSKLKGAKRVFIDVSGYRAKRTADLQELARKIAGKVEENKRSYRLDPMNSFERRIIHEELSKTPHILTHSEGTDPNRFLVIEYTED